jgi:hypothetical protein
MKMESLVVIRTFGSLHDADEAQAELLSAGIYSLLYAEDPRFPPAEQREVALAVHSRDAQIAEAVLTPHPRMV